MTRPSVRRIVALVAGLGTALLTACSNPTAPSESGGIYGGAGTKMVSGGIYGGAGTQMVSGGIYGGAGTR